MKPLAQKTLASIGTSLLLLLPTLPSMAQKPGEAVDGLELSITDGGTDQGVQKLIVSFRKLRDGDINLSLGTVGGQGPRPCVLPDREAICTLDFKLQVTDARGTARTFQFRGAQLVAGRLDAYIVTIRRGSYQFELGLDQFWSPDTKESEVKLAPGKNELSLEYESHAPIINLDQEYLKKITFWKGKVVSNSVTIEQPAGN